MYDRFKGKLALSLAAYNAGPTAVERYNTVPPYDETEAYVEKVLKYYYNYKNL
jgi:soluble lytic murein transglycosylase